MYNIIPMMSFVMEMCIRDRSNTVMPVMRRIVNVSTNRSVTTVPNDLANETLSYFANTPQRLTSPIRGTTRLAAYEMKIAFTQSLFFGKASNGSNVCLHRQPRKTCANTPNNNEKSCLLYTSYLHHRTTSSFLQADVCPQQRKESCWCQQSLPCPDYLSLMLSAHKVPMEDSSSQASCLH